MAESALEGNGCAITAARRRARHSGAPMSQASTPIATTAIAMSGADVTSAVGLLQSLDQLDVVLLRLVARGALELGPRVVLGAVDHVEGAWPVAGHVTRAALLVESVQAQHVLVVGTLGQGLHGGLRGREVLVEIRHAGLPSVESHSIPERRSG